MLWLSGKVVPDLPAMLTPRMRQDPPAGQPWAADTGRYASPHEYTDSAYLQWLEKMRPHADRCLFATAPDTFGSAPETLALSLPMLAPIRAAGYRAALVAQPRLKGSDVPWDDVDVLFVGGPNPWQHSEALVRLVAEARGRGKWVHMGRVNTLRRLRYAASIGCHSADGTLLRYDQSAPIREWTQSVAGQSVAFVAGGNIHE